MSAQPTDTLTTLIAGLFAGGATFATWLNQRPQAKLVTQQMANMSSAYSAQLSSVTATYGGITRDYEAMMTRKDADIERLTERVKTLEDRLNAVVTDRDHKIADLEKQVSDLTIENKALRARVADLEAKQTK